MTAPPLAWSPGVYGRHAAPRLRPALDLLARVPLEGAATVVDLGCGAGALFPALRARFPDARLVGVDLSAEMLAEAAAADPGAELVQSDAATWRPEAAVDLILANASLHWVPDQERLIPDLLGRCRVLAVQVPDNFQAPAHRAIRKLMAAPPWERELADAPMGEHVLPAEAYLALLRGAGASVDLWRTTYYQLLEGPDAVLAWVRGTTLLPVQAALGGAAAPGYLAFEAALGERLRAAYPPDAAGVTTFPFRRLFLVASAAA